MPRPTASRPLLDGLLQGANTAQAAAEAASRALRAELAQRLTGRRHGDWPSSQAKTPKSSTPMGIALAR